MGNGWLFPGTYSRLASFRRSARRGLKIIVGTVPVFVIAAFIEGFFTRHTEWPDAVRLTVILLSLLLVVGYYIYLPYKHHYGIQSKENLDLQGAQLQREV
jgi:undecaprenyl pyrophosphate phosphatase UppP